MRVTTLRLGLSLALIAGLLYIARNQGSAEDCPHKCPDTFVCPGPGPASCGPEVNFICNPGTGAWYWTGSYFTGTQTVTYNPNYEQRPMGAGQLKCYDVYTCTWDPAARMCIPTGAADPTKAGFMNVLTKGCENCPF